MLARRCRTCVSTECLCCAVQSSAMIQCIFMQPAASMIHCQHDSPILAVWLMVEACGMTFDSSMELYCKIHNYKYCEMHPVHEK